MASRQHLTAWGIALFSVLVLWGLGNVSVGFASRGLGVNSIIYTCSLFMASSLVLLLYGGPGPLARETLRSIDTWGYGFVLITSFILSFLLFREVTSAEGALLQRSSIIASVFAGWLFLARPPNKSQLVGMLMVFGGVAVVCAGTMPERRGLIVFLVVIFGMLQAARVFIAELHRPHAQAADLANKDPRGRARVVGFVMFVVSSLFLLFAFLMALAQVGASEHAIPGMPTLADFTHPSGILLGLIVGALIIAPIRAIEFYSAHTIKAENYLILSSLSPVATLFWEWLTQPITGLDLLAFTQSDLIAGAVITAGGFVMAFGKLRKPKAQEEIREYLTFATQDPQAVADTREVVAATIEHADGKLSEAAILLDLPQAVIQALLRDQEQVLALRPEILKKVLRHYRKEVAEKDALTGLLNRAAFMKELRAATAVETPFTVFFIDLNKFKPVNDTHGHEAGDYVLQTIAERLKQAVASNGLVTRLGGDEFCILAREESTAQTYLSLIEQEIALPESGTVVSVSASIGVVSYPTDGEDATELLAKADKLMYAEKEETSR